MPSPKGLILFLNFVAPIALEPIPASQANTIFLISPAFFAIPLLAAFILWTLSEASSRLFPLDILMIGAATRKETTAAITTPSSTINVDPFGAIVRKAMIDPGEAGPVSPTLNKE